jgi:hypothetical protein
VRGLLLGLGLAGCCVAAVIASGAGAKSTIFKCNGTFNHQTFGAVDVPANAVCRMQNDTINGSVTVEGQLFASVLDVSGDVSSDGGKVVQIDSSTISGDMKLKNMTGAPSNEDAVSIVINVIQGKLKIKNDSGGTGDFLTSTNTVHDKEKVSGNVIPGDLAVTAEQVDGDLIVNANTGGGTKEVDGNTSGTLISCNNNQNPFESHGNNAPTVSGQCH